MKLRDALERKRFIVTSEIHAPPELSSVSLINDLKKVRGRVDGFSVCDMELEGIVGDSLKTCEFLRQNRFEAIYQTTTREKDRLTLQKDLLSAHNAGVENLLVFTEDYRITGDSLQEMMFFHVDSGKLSSVLEHLKNGSTVEGKEIATRPEFFLGSGVESSWGKNIPDLELKEMETLTEMGTGFFLSTPVFDTSQFEKYLKQVNTFGIPIIAEVLILRTAGMARFLNRHLKSNLVPDWVIQKLSRANDKQKASIELFADIVSELKHLCRGIHIISMGGEEKLKPYFDAANLR
ncbi:MAG: methylenetetrahydrofolate reductase [Desulfobacterales bacterium]